MRDALYEVREYAKRLVDDDTCWQIDEHCLLRFQGELLSEEPVRSKVLYNDLKDASEQFAFILYYASSTFSYVQPADGSEYSYRLNEEVLYRTNAYVTALLEAKVRWDDPRAVLQLSDTKWREVLQLDTSNLYLADQRIDAIRKLASTFSQGLIKGLGDTRIDVDVLFSCLMRTGLFEDRFLKRIQMALAFLEDAAHMYGVEYVGGAPLTAMADYRLPQVFINTGVLCIDEGLKSRLMKGSVMLKNSSEELLLRAYSIEICRRLSVALHTTEAKIDSLVWGYSQQMLAHKMFKIPAPRVLTDCY